MSEAAKSRRRRRIGAPMKPALLAELRDEAVLGRFVLPPAQELGAVADAAARDVVEGHLADELGAEALPDELLLGLPAARLAGAPLVGAVRLEQLEQLALLSRPEAGGVTDDVELPVVVVHAEDERAHGARLLAEAERGHHRVRGAHALHLDHPGALAGTVGRGPLLRDHTLGARAEPGLRRLP